MLRSNLENINIFLKKEIKQTTHVSEQLDKVIEQLLALEKKKDKIHWVLLQTKRLPKQKKKQLKAAIQDLEDAKLEVIQNIKGKEVLWYV